MRRINSITNIIKSQELVGIDKESGFDLDEKEMRRYIEWYYKK